MSRKTLTKIFALCLCMIPCGGVNAAQDKTSQVIPAARAADVASIDAIVASVYDVISGPAGQKRDWDRMRSLFIPGARLVPVNGQAGEARAARVLSVEDYIARSSAVLEKQGFFERERARRLEKFGHIAQAFSTYESRRKADDPAPFSRGINSFQLMNDGMRWLIVTIFWEAEGPDNPIPPEYLK